MDLGHLLLWFVLAVIHGRAKVQVYAWWTNGRLTSLLFSGIWHHTVDLFQQAREATRASLEGHSMSIFLTLEESLSACWVVVTLWCLCCHPRKPFLDNPAKYFCNTVSTATQYVTNTYKNYIFKNSTWHKNSTWNFRLWLFSWSFCKIENSGRQ